MSTLDNVAATPRKPARQAELATLNLSIVFVSVLAGFIFAVVFGSLFSSVARCDPTCSDTSTELKVDGNYACGGAVYFFLEFSVSD